MQESCHRCGGELSGETAFCPQCGAPQLTLALEQQSVDTGDRPDAAASTGAAAPPLPRAVDWKIVIRYAAIVAIVGALLSLAAVKIDLLSLPSALWLMSASLITLAMYQKRLPTARIDAGIGARIGVVVGLCLALGLTCAKTAWELVDRYALHGMGSFDKEFAAQMLEAQKQSQQIMAAHSIPVAPNMTAFSQSAEFQAGVVLAGYAMLAVLLMVVSAVGGAFGGLLRMRRR
ncbi:MAG TPA: zinc ribbon domain-containing protein [Acidobacteriaceae bacterium]|nr:zinc ribbon domain-containing protein [Acidobacteriaceae bacterium]